MIAPFLPVDLRSGIGWALDAEFILADSQFLRRSSIKAISLMCPHRHLAKIIVLLTLRSFGNPEISLNLHDID